MESGLKEPTLLSANRVHDPAGEPIRTYVEDLEHRFPRGYLTAETYAVAMTAFVILCVDILVIDRSRKRIYLARRSALPHQGLWWVGGRMYPGESFAVAAARKFQEETHLVYAPERFVPLTWVRTIWKYRQQEPQEAGSDTLSFVMTLELSEWEAGRALLDRNEYACMSLEPFDSLEALQAANAHPCLVDAYRQLFPE